MLQAESAKLLLQGKLYWGWIGLHKVAGLVNGGLETAVFGGSAKSIAGGGSSKTPMKTMARTMQIAKKATINFFNKQSTRKGVLPARPYHRYL